VKRRVYEEIGRKGVKEECENFREIMKRKGINMSRERAERSGFGVLAMEKGCVKVGCEMSNLITFWYIIKVDFCMKNLTPKNKNLPSLRSSHNYQ
jgi:MOSC domain-containing protein YiiM